MTPGCPLDIYESIIVSAWTNVNPFDLWESDMLYLGHVSVHWRPGSPILSLCGHLKVHYWCLCGSLLQSLDGHINVHYYLCDFMREKFHKTKQVFRSLCVSSVSLLRLWDGG